MSNLLSIIIMKCHCHKNNFIACIAFVAKIHFETLICVVDDRRSQEQ